MILWICIGVVLFLFCVGLVLYLLALKRELQNLKKELSFTRERGYNRQLTVSLFDRDLTMLGAEMNHNLDYQKQLKREAEQSELKLKQSISDIAHDLRTPLTVIKGNLQMLAQDDSISSKAREYVKLCQSKSEVLKDMVNDFFEMSVLESDSTQVELSEIDITKLLMQFIIDHETIIREHHLVPDIRLPERSVTVFADEQMLLRMLGNLLGNVLKYAKESFWISVEAMGADLKADVETGTDTDIKSESESDAVSDSGVASRCRITFANRVEHDFPPDAEHLFERTYRGNQARTGTGAGLGLYIVRLLADKQGAQVYATKEKDCLAFHMVFQMKRER